MSNFQFVTGDTGSKLRVTCTDASTGLPINLTDATVNLFWKDAAGALVTQAMTLVTPASGIAEYKFAADELFSPQMSFEVQITKSDGDILSGLDPIVVPIREQIG